MAKASRARKEYKFYLYDDMPADVELMTYIAHLQKTRQFADVIRSGLRLLWSLNDDDLSVLFEAFPELRARFIPNPDELIEQFRLLLQAQAVPSAAPQPPGGLQQLELPMELPPRDTTPAPTPRTELMERAIQEAVQVGIQKALNNLAPPAPAKSVTGTHPQVGLQPLSSTRSIEMPVFEDDDDTDTVVIRRDPRAGGQITNNFLDSVMGLQQLTDDEVEAASGGAG